MLRWFRKTYPSYNLQPLLLKRYRELEEARAFNNWLGERRQAQEGQRHLDDVSRLTEAVHRQVPQLRYARAERRTKLRNNKRKRSGRTASTSARALSRRQRRLAVAASFRAQAQSNNTPRPFSWGLNPVALPQSQSLRASSSSGQSRRSLPPPSFDQLARDIEAA